MNKFNKSEYSRKRKLFLNNFLYFLIHFFFEIIFLKNKNYTTKDSKVNVFFQGQQTEGPKLVNIN